jgi:hypothetical protein
MTFGGLRSDNLPSDDYEERDDRWYMHDSVIDTGRARGRSKVDDAVFRNFSSYCILQASNIYIYIRP